MAASEVFVIVTAKSMKPEPTPNERFCEMASGPNAPPVVLADFVAPELVSAVVALNGFPKTYPAAFWMPE